MRPGESASNRSWWAISESLGVVPSKSESHEFQYLKRSKTSPPIHRSNFRINIDDLPDPLLFEILLRLPVKCAARYKCVSRRWFALISHHTFLSRFLCLQSDKRKPLPMKPTLIFSYEKKEFFAIPELPMFKTGSFSLDFLPCYQSTKNKKATDQFPVVIASCNDLLLCCASTIYQRDYYICNPYTKQWTALPPAPQCRFEVRVGFTCDPYYYYKEDVDQREKDSNSTCSSTIQLNVDYKYAIVRILSPLLPRLNSLELNVEIFSSETGKWTESVVLGPPNLRFNGLRNNPGVAYKGKLYWVHEYDHRFMIALDPFSNNNNTNNNTTDRKYYFHVVDLPSEEWGAISVSQEGRLRLCRGLLFGDGDIEHLRKGLSIWELKDDDDDKVDGRVGKWCMINTRPLDKMVSENPLITEWSRSNDPALEVAFDPNNDDILYVRSYGEIIMCNIRANTLKEVTTNNSWLISVFRFMVPWWPTPVPKIEYNNHEDTHAAHLNSCLFCSKFNLPHVYDEILTELHLKYMYEVL